MLSCTPWQSSERVRLPRMHGGSCFCALHAELRHYGGSLHTCRCRSIGVWGPGGEMLQTIPGSPDDIVALCWASDHLLAAATSASVTVWHVTECACKTYASYSAPDGRAVTSLAAAPNAAWLAAAVGGAAVSPVSPRERACVLPCRWVLLLRC